jgi:AcrR family transcriptional regulator
MEGSSVTAQPRRYARSAVTREKLLDAAERLFAQHGISTTTKRQLTETAGQSNNAAVDYHFGSWENLVRAVLERHAVDVDQRRERLLAELPADPNIHELVDCMVRPFTDHLADLPTPTWYARLSLQALADPKWRPLAVSILEDSPSMRAAAELMTERGPVLDVDLAEERYVMGRLLVLHMCANRERDIEEEAPPLRRTWHEAGDGLVEAITALWLPRPS